MASTANAANGSSAQAVAQVAAQKLVEQGAAANAAAAAAAAAQRNANAAKSAVMTKTSVVAAPTAATSAAAAAEGPPGFLTSMCSGAAIVAIVGAVMTGWGARDLGAKKKEDTGYKVAAGAVAVGAFLVCCGACAIKMTD